jgi:hypothetical protein
MSLNVFIGVVTETGKLVLDAPKVFKAYIARFIGDEVEVEVRKRRSKRSTEQNSAFHAMIMPWALSEGHDIEDLKDDCLGAVFGYSETVNAVTGEVKMVLAKPHTSKLTVAEFNELMERTAEIAARCGVVLELPDEYKTRKKAEQKPKRRSAA